MPKRSRKPADLNRLAAAIVDEATGQASPADDGSSEAARKAAKARWGSSGDE